MPSRLRPRLDHRGATVVNGPQVVRVKPWQPVAILVTSAPRSTGATQGLRPRLGVSAANHPAGAAQPLRLRHPAARTTRAGRGFWLRTNHPTRAHQPGWPRPVRRTLKTCGSWVC